MAKDKSTKKNKRVKRKKEDVEDAAEVATAVPKKKMKKSKKAKKAKKVKKVEETAAPTTESPKKADAKELKKLTKAFKVAKKAWKADKKNKDLKKAFKAAKAAKLAAESVHTEDSKPTEDAMEVETPAAEETPAKVEAQSTKEQDAAPAAGEDECTTIFCGNMPWSVDEDMVKATFKECGEIANIRWGQDRETGDFKGYAHIDFNDAASCAKAIKMNGMDCGGREMRIDASKPRSGGKTPQKGHGGPFNGPTEVPANPDQVARCFVGNLDYKIDEDGLKNAFKEKGMNIIDIFFMTDRESGEFFGSSFCEFENADQAAKAVAHKGMPIMGRPVKIDFARPRAGGEKGGKKKREQRPPSERPEGGTDTAFFGNLSFDIDEEKMKTWLTEVGAGDVASVRWLTDRDSGEFKGCGFVQFNSVESVDKVVAKSGSDLLGRSVRVDFANSK